MFCTNCGSQVDDGQKFCPNCGTKLEPLNDEAVVQEAARQAYQQPAPPAYQQPVQGAYQQPTYQQPPYQQPVYQQQVAYQQPVYTQPAPVPSAPVRRKNGPAVTALVFGIITLVLLIVALLLFREAIVSYYYSGEVYAAVALICYFLACFLYIFNFIFGIIGFVRGLKTKVKRAVGIIGFVLIFINAVLIIWEAAAFVGIMIALM